MATDKAFELKDKLQKLVKIILDGDDYTEHTADEAITTLSALKDLKCSTSLHHIPVPPQFRCPISGNLMTDPVILCTGQTYDRYFIEKWLNEVHKTCPQTQQVLSHTILTPNCLVQHMISQWCKDHEIQLPKPVGVGDGDTKANAEEEVTDEQKIHLHLQLLNLSLSNSDKKQAAKEIRQLTKNKPSIRTLFGNSKLIEELLNPLSAGMANIDPEVHEDLITTLLNLSIHDGNKKMLGENERVISILIDSLKPGTGATIQTRSNAATAIFCLSAIDSNKRIIGRAGAIKYLVELLEVKNLSANRDAANAIFNLCIARGNKERTIREGAIQVILFKIMDHILVDELLSILALLSSHYKAVEVLCNHGAVPFLLAIMKDDGMSERSKENCVAILHEIFFGDRTKRKEIRDDEISNHTLSKIAQYGTLRAKRKANAILHKINPPSSSKTAT